MLKQDIQLKPLAESDAVLLRDLAVQAYTEHYADTWYDGGAWYIKTYFSLERIQEELQDQNAYFSLIYYRGSAVGFVKLNVDKPVPDGQTNALELERIYLLKNVSGKGIGTVVLNFIFDFARKHNKKQVWLKVMDTSPNAVRFYQKMGFTICGTHQVDFVQKREGMRDMYIMQKAL